MSGADFNFYNHELQEAEMVANGMEQEAAHAATLESQGVSRFSIYHPEVIENAVYGDGSPVFNPNWFNYWGIQ